jgi:uncharacterized damage-inducible protein DinB
MAPSMAPFTLDALRELLRHMEWADATVWRAALGHPPAVHDARLRDLLLHLHGVQRAFLGMWTSAPLQFAKSDQFADLTAVQAWSQPYYQELADFLSTVGADSLDRIIDMPWLAEFEARTGRSFTRPTLAETMFQVTSHSTYHRGQVNARLREVGGEPPLVDYIAWVWFGKPEPEWVGAQG